MNIASIKVIGYIDVEIPDHINDTDIAEDWINEHLKIEDTQIKELDDYTLHCTYLVDWGEVL
jgi:hypothetical protein